MKKQSKNEPEYQHRVRFDCGQIFGLFLESKSVQNQAQNGFGRALDEDIVSKLQEDTAKFIWTAQARFKIESFGASGGGKQGGGKWLHTPDVPWTSQGVGGSDPGPPIGPLP